MRKHEEALAKPALYIMQSVARFVVSLALKGRRAVSPCRKLYLH